MIDRNKIGQESLFYKEVDNLITERQHICSVLSDESFERSGSLSGTGCTSGTIESHLSFVLNKRRSATRTNGWYDNYLLVSISNLHNRSDDLRDNLSRAHDENLIAFHNSFFGKFVIIM